MPTWLGILLLGNLLGRRRRSFGRSLLFGGLLGWLFHRNFDLEEMQADVHKAARKVRKAVRKAKHEFRDIGRAVRDQAQMKTDEHVDAVLQQVEASQARDEERRRKTDEKIAAAQAKIEEIRTRLAARLPNLQVLSTICDATGERQAEARSLAGHVDAMVIVGGRQSGNTRRLAALASEAGVATYHVETAEELKAEDFRGVATVGLTAGASTPKALIDAAEERLRNMA